MTRTNLLLRIGLGLLPLVVVASAAPAATDLSHSLTTFSGDNTQPATQTAVAAAGFNFFDTVTPISFNSAGAHFDPGFVGNDGRNYMRTIQDDYANVSFRAEITMVAPDIDNQDAYFGLGAGNAAIEFGFRTPDWTTDFASVMYWGETEIAEPSVQTFRTNDSKDGPFVTTAAPALTNGTHRVRMDYDWFTKQVTYSFDFNYTGTFSADTTAPPVNVLSHYIPTGWPNEPARIYFGGDEDIVFKDFSVDALTGEMLMGDFNSSGAITEADWAILRDNMHTNLSSLTLAQAFFLGDLTGDKANNHDDFVAFKILYEDANGAGSFARMLAGVPEPSTLLMFVVGLLSAGLTGRRGVYRV
jgi:hypothetical protein